MNGSQLNQMLERIAHIQVLIVSEGAPNPNVMLAEPYQPSTVSSNTAPFFVNETHGGPSNLPIASGQQYLTTDVWMVLCVRRFEANTNLKLGENEKMMWRDVVYRAFSQRVKLSDPEQDNVIGHSHEGLPFVLDCYIKSMEPIKYLYADSEWLSLKFILTVNELYVTPIAA